MEVEIDFDLYSILIDVKFTGTGDKFVEVWSELRRHGYKPDTRPSEKGDGSFNTYWRRADVATIWMYFTSSVCRRVQVGTKLVEQPVYETQCGELPILEDGNSKNELAELI